MDLTNFRINAIKKVISRWSPKIIQATERADILPKWVVPQLRGGRFGSRAEILNADGKALLEQLDKELGEGGSGVPIPAPSPVPAQPVPAAKPGPSPSYPKPPTQKQT